MIAIAHYLSMERNQESRVSDTFLIQVSKLAHERLGEEKSVRLLAKCKLSLEYLKMVLNVPNIGSLIIKASI